MTDAMTDAIEEQDRLKAPQRPPAAHFASIMSSIDALARKLSPPQYNAEIEADIVRIRYAVARALGCDPFADQV